MSGAISLLPIGYVRSEVKSRKSAPRQGRETGLEAEVKVLPEYVDALDGVDDWDMLQLICWLHESERDILKVRPRRDPSLGLRGVFATRSPVRPNPLAVYAVELLAVDGTLLRVKGLDTIDGTPALDIRPHIHRLDD